MSEPAEVELGSDPTRTPLKHESEPQQGRRHVRFPCTCENTSWRFSCSVVAIGADLGFGWEAPAPEQTDFPKQNFWWSAPPGPCSCIPFSIAHESRADIRAGELESRSGSIQAALNLEIAGDSVHRFNIKLEGLNGQLPNLDLVNTVSRLCRREGIPPALHKRVRILPIENAIYPVGGSRSQFGGWSEVGGAHQDPTLVGRI